MIKRLLFTLTAALACATASYGQISFSSVGTGVKTFDSAPVVADGWSTASFGAAAGTYTTSNGLYTAVQTVAASSVATVLPTSGTVPPSLNLLGRYNTTLQRLQIRPTTSDYTVIMATLRNDSGADVPKITIAYQMSAMVTNDSTIAESPELYGWKVFYSTSGAAGSWNIIPELSLPTTGTFTNDLSAVVNIAGLWTANTPLYILWADDNGPSSDAAPSREGAYTLDNFSVTSPIIGIALTSPANNATFPNDFPVTLTAAANSEGAITSVDFRDGGTLLSNVPVPPYTFTTSTLSLGSHTLTAVSHDSLGNNHTSPAITITIHPNQPPVIASLANTLGATSFYVGSNLTYTANATDDGAVTNVDFLVDGVLRWTRAAAPYQYVWSDLVAGTHTLTAIAADYKGLKATNSSSLTVTNPPNITVLLSNGSLWKYWDEGVDPGATWKDIGFNDTGWSNGIAEIGYGDTDANRPEITVSRQIVGTPGTPSAITNATQLFRTHFNVANPSSSTGVVVRLMADDGAVVYINGNPVANLNMTAGTPYTAFSAAGSGDDGAGFFDFNIPLSSVVAGDNLVAVEVHQANIGSTDISFDLMIWGTRPPAPTLTITPLIDGTFDVSWPTGLPQSCVQIKSTLDEAWTDTGLCHPDPDATSDPGVGGRYSFNADPSALPGGGLPGTAVFFRLAPPGN